MKKPIALEKFARYAIENGMPSIDTFTGWGYGRSTYYKVRNQYELIRAHAIAAREADKLISYAGIGYPVLNDDFKKAFHDYYTYDKERELYESWGG